MAPFKPIRGIKRRWLFNNLAYVALVIVLAVVLYSVAAMNFYYNSVRMNLTNRVQVNSQYFNDNVNTNFESFYANAKRQTMEFADKDKLERQILYSDGRILFSSSGLPTGMIPGTPDIDAALNESTVKTFTGKNPLTGERVMSVSSPLITSSNQVVGVMRYVTSMREVDSKVMLQSGLALLLGMIVFLLVFMSNKYFIKSIVNPLKEIISTTKQIAKGSYGAKIEKTFDDEVGELCDSINEMSAELARSEKMKNEFISSVSHELRTPLTAVIGWAETIAAVGVDHAEEAQKGISVILKETRRLSKMVEELLDFARMESGRFNLCVEPMDLKAEFEETLFMYHETFKKQGLEIKYEQCDEDIYVNGDRERLKQVFFNILDNAVKHGKNSGRLELCADMDEKNAWISIRDFGEGIPEEELPYVKLKFYKGTSKVTGSGIGLAVSDEIVNLHGGELRIESVYGEGTTVTIVLPRYVPEQEEAKIGE